MKRSIFTVLGTILLLAACGELNGTLNVTSPLPLSTKKHGEISLAPGSYSAQFSYDQDKRQIKIKVKQAANGKDEELQLNLPPGQTIPTNSGSFTVKGSDVGQNFNMAGNINTQVDDTPQTTTNQSCTYTTYERVCREYPVTGRDGRVYYERRCDDEPVTRYGQQEVTYHVETTTVTGNVNFNDATGETQLATFAGENTNSQTINDYVGTCY